jgi:hypothetical protein
MLQQAYGKKPEFMELAEFPAVMGIAIGKQAVAYNPTGGVTSGEDVLQAYFRNDLGNTSESIYCCIRALLTLIQFAGTICDCRKLLLEIVLIILQVH